MALVAAILLTLGVVVGVFVPALDALRPSPRIAGTDAILKQVQNLSQWVTVKYVIEKVVILEDAKWYGENRVLLLAHGVVKGGVDLSRLKADDIQVSGKQIALRIPQATVTDVYLDEQKTRVIERTTGLLRTFDINQEQNARRQAVDDLRRAARNSGIYDEANERARAHLKSLLSWMGFEQVTFKD